jgi:uncharacterized protein (TIGR00369 family)
MSRVSDQDARSAAENQCLQAILRDVVENRICFNAVLGIKTLSFEPQAPQVSFDMRPQLIGHYGVGRLHGGVIAAVLDVVAGFAIGIALAEKYPAESAEQVMNRVARLGTIDLRVDYLHPGLGQSFVAGAKVTRLGGRIASVQMDLRNETELLIATGSAAYVVS